MPGRSRTGRRSHRSRSDRRKGRLDVGPSVAPQGVHDGRRAAFEEGASRSRAESGSSARSKPVRYDRGRAESRTPKGALPAKAPSRPGTRPDRNRYHGGSAVRRDHQTTVPVARSEHTARRTHLRWFRTRGKRPGRKVRWSHRRKARATPGPWPCEPRTPKGDPPAEVPLRSTEIRLGS